MELNGLVFFWTNAGWLNLAKEPSGCEVKDERSSAVFELAMVTDLQQKTNPETRRPPHI